SGPIPKVVNAVIRAILRCTRVKLSLQTLAQISHDDLHAALDIVHQNGRFERADKDRLHDLFDLEELEVSDVMRHRTAMRAVNADDTPEAVVRTILECYYTRIPQWRNSAENIIGIIHAKDLLRALAEPNADASTIDIVKIDQKPLFVP